MLCWCVLTIDRQEAKYRSLDEEEEKKKKLQLSKMSKYKKVVYWFELDQAKNNKSK